MYKIMLVDDEDEVREGITATVDFAACGFTLCAQATGAIDAIEKAAQFQPDVAFTDVHMPYMDGMEMISRLQEMYPTMKYIVLSGYDDFIYVKQALQRQVLDYLLKPLSAQGIMKVLRRAKEQLDEQDRQRVNLEILRDKVAKNAQQLRRGVVLEYLSGSFGGDAHALCAYPQPVDERIAFPMYLAVLSLERTEENLEVLRRDFDSQPMLLGASVEEVLSEVFKRRQGEFIQYRSQFLLLLPASQEEAIAACDDAIQSLRHYLHLTATAGLSDEIGSYSALSEGYQNAMAALDKRLIAGQGQVYTPSSSPESRRKDLELDAWLTRAAALCRSGKKEEIAAFCGELAQHVANAQMDASERQPCGGGARGRGRRARLPRAAHGVGAAAGGHHGGRGAARHAHAVRLRRRAARGRNLRQRAHRAGRGLYAEQLRGQGPLLRVAVRALSDQPDPVFPAL